MGHQTFIPRDYDVFAGLDVDKRSISVTFTDHQGLLKSLMIRKGHRDAALVHIESGKHIVVTRDECLVPHRSASFGSTAKNLTIVPVTEHSALITTSLIQVSGRTELILNHCNIFSVHAERVEAC